METLQANTERPKPYEPIVLSLKESDVLYAIDAYKDFLHLPLEERNKIRHVDKLRPRTGVSGYEYKSAADKKHVFHMAKGLEHEFSAGFMRLPAETRRLLMGTIDIYNLVSASVKEKFEELEEYMPGVTGIHFPKDGDTAHHLRLIGYETSGEILAQGHYDKSTATIAIAESHGGLRLGFGDDDLEMIDRENYDPVFFMGYGWHQLAEILDTSPPNYRAGWHDVIDTGEQHSDEIKRWAMVLFVNPARLYLESTQEQTHTPIPWRGLGSAALRSDGKSFLV